MAKDFVIQDGFLYMGNYDAEGRKCCLGYAPGRQWREVYGCTPAQFPGGMSGWVPVAEYVAYITGLAANGRPQLLEKWQAFTGEGKGNG